ncbi:MAG: tripartite tricarboxylate transporter substrate binding protein [Syntrophales bacterium]|jgi:tripartite-type tricarboxylate transporter receptor subunit TctC|nr:tripartite tricarboxylate transporter substrate binding protein [Syntrophales bacterium]
MNHLRKVTLFLALTMIAMLTVGGLCFGAEKYPTKPIQVIVPYAAGGSSDVLARTVEKVWTKYSPQPLLIVDKPGAGGVLGTEYVIRAKPDGYTVLFAYGSGCDLVMPHLQKMPYDHMKDLAPVARLSIHSVVVNVSGKSQFKTMKDVLDWGAKGNKITAAVSTAAGSVDLVMRAISKRAGVSITTVPFTGGADAVTALAGGHLVIGGGHPSEVMPHIKSGRFRPIGVALDRRDGALPNVPTLKEQGINVSTWGSVKGVAVPAGTPPEIIAYLESTLKKVCEDKDFIKTMIAIGQPVDYLNTKDWAAFIPKAYKDYGDLIKELGIKI